MEHGSIVTVAGYAPAGRAERIEKGMNMKTRIEIKDQAKVCFNEQYWLCVLAFAIYSALSSIASGATAGIAVFLLIPPMTVGYAYFSLRIYNGEPTEIVDMFDAGFKDYGRSLVGILWMELFTFLWSLLFIIPGIIKAISYSMTPYILADMEDISAPKTR